MVIETFNCWKFIFHMWKFTIDPFWKFFFKKDWFFERKTFTSQILIFIQEAKLKVSESMAKPTTTAIRKHQKFVNNPFAKGLYAMKRGRKTVAIASKSYGLFDRQTGEIEDARNSMLTRHRSLQPNWASAAFHPDMARSPWMFRR